MITYVNTVFVSNLAENAAVIAQNIENPAKGQFVLVDVDTNKKIDEKTVRFKIGMGTGKTAKQVNPSTGATTNVPVIKWSNIINVADIKGWTKADYAQDTEDKVYIDFSNIDDDLVTKFAKGGKRIIVRLTFKDMPHRFRKWTESYEYVTTEGDTAATIATAIVNMINKEWKRARVIAKQGSATITENANGVSVGTFTPSASGTMIELEAMKYDDDESVDSLNWYNKVRFNANVYYTDPAAEGWDSLNKYFPKGVKIVKVPGKTYQASAKLVRDREAQAMGYEGILNRGEGTWPIIKPAMETNLNGQYNVVTLEFENMYRTADDLFRKTKQTVEIYTTGATTAIINALGALTGIIDKTIEAVPAAQNGGQGGNGNS